MRFPSAVVRNPAVESWLDGQLGDLGVIAHYWFDVLRACGDDVRETLNDGRPVACIGDAAFSYVDVFTHHAALGFFHGTAVPDPDGLLEGSGRFMRHVKIRPGRPVDADAVRALIGAACRDLRQRIARE